MEAWAIGDLAFNGGQGAWADMNTISWNRFNNNETTILGSNNTSFYKGAPVFNTNGNRLGLFYAIFITRETNLN